MYAASVAEIRSLFAGAGYDLADPRRGSNTLYIATPSKRGALTSTRAVIGRGRTAHEAAENAWQLFEAGYAPPARTADWLDPPGYLS